MVLFCILTSFMKLFYAEMMAVECVLISFLIEPLRKMCYLLYKSEVCQRGVPMISDEYGWYVYSSSIYK